MIQTMPRSFNPPWKPEGIACATTRVQNREDFVAALEQGGIDLILSDFSLPAFDGLSALEIARARWPDLPVILVSGTLGEERAIDALKSGATDYVLKERLARLVPAVHRAMLEVEERVERRLAERKREEYSHKLQVLSRRLVEAQETERRHLARELHDEIGQALTVAQLNLQALLQLPDANALKPRLKKSLKVVERVLEQVHDISLNLRPSILDDLGLEPALRWLTGRQAALVGLQAEVPRRPAGATPGPGDRNRVFPRGAGSIDECGAPRQGESCERGIAQGSRAAPPARA